MKTVRRSNETAQRTALCALLIVATAAASHAATQYWNPTTTPKGAGAGIWSASAGAWANTTTGTNSPVAWVDGNDANFSLNDGANTVTINAPVARRLDFDTGAFTFTRGSGSLTLSGPLVSNTARLTFNNDFVLAGNQTWNLNGETLVTGGISGNYTLTKTGSGALTLHGGTSQISALTWQDGASLSLIDASLHTTGSITVPQDGGKLFVTNSYLRFGNGDGALLQPASGKSNTEILIGPGSWIDAGGKGGLWVGQGGGSNNLLVLDGVVVTNMLPRNPKGVAVGSGTGSSGNIFRMTNGSEVWDQGDVNDAGNAVGNGIGANNNRLEVIGGEGVVTKLYKGFPNVIGNGTGTSGNAIVIDGKGFPGSAVFDARNTISVGSSGAVGNFLRIADGGQVINPTFILGNNASHNRVEIVGTGSTLNGSAASSIFSIGVSNASSNTMYVADAGEVRGFGNYQAAIGGYGGGAGAGTIIGNRLIVGPGGFVNINNHLVIGRISGTGSIARDNQILVTGKGGRLRGIQNRELYIGQSYNGAAAIGNELRVEHGADVFWDRNEWNYHPIYVGCMGDNVAGTDSRDNRIVVTDGGQILFGGQIFVGAVNGANISSNNSVVASFNGVIEADVLVIRADANNTISAIDGGVLQFSSRTPTITPLAPGNIFIRNGVFGFTHNNNSFAIRDHLSNQFTNITFFANNGLRLNGVSLNPYTDNSYLFEPDVSPTDWAFLQMVNGTTVYQTRTQDTGSLTIGVAVGSAASMLCSNTVATVSLPYVLNGELTLCNSTLTLTKDATLNGEVVIDLDHLASGTPLAAQQNLTVGNGAILRFTGAPPKGTELITLMTCDGVRDGTFNARNVPPDYSLKYNIGAPGNVVLIWAPVRTIFMVR